jgi:hypothetical protein
MRLEVFAAQLQDVFDSIREGSPMERCNDLFARVQQQNGGGQRAARDLRSARLAAGFTPPSLPVRLTLPTR